MAKPRSCYFTLEDFKAKFGPQPKATYTALQTAFDKADAAVIGAFVSTPHSVPIEGLDPISTNRLKQWAIRLAGGDATALDEMERAKADGNLRAVRRR